MTNKTLFLCVTLTALFSFCFSATAEQSVSAKRQAVTATPAFWKVSKKAGAPAQLFLFGSVHFGHKSFYPLPAEIETAYAASDAIAVEVDITKVNPNLLLKAASLPPGKKLSAVLDADVYKALNQYATQQNIPISAFSNFQPWFVAMQLVQAELAKTDYNALLGIEMHFLQRKNKPVLEVESIEKQMALFSALTDTDQNVFLRQTLEDMSKSQDYLALMMSSWKKGDVHVIENQMIKPIRELKEAKHLYKLMFSDRNVLMANVAESYMRAGKKVFFVVGAAHLIGNDGVLALLKAKGYSVERVAF